MTAANLDFPGYLESLMRQYKSWWEVDALTATIKARQAMFTFEQEVQTEEKVESAAQQLFEESTTQTISLPLISGIQAYAKVEPVLLVGSPGVGKSSALLRCLVEYAKQELAKPEPERIPVLIRLKNYQGNLISSDDPTGMLALIKNALKPKFKRRIEISEIEEWLFEGRLILLLDGLNEMPSSSVRTQLQSFCEDLDQTSLICSTRELGAGDLGINRKLVIQPPDSKEIDRFLRECIPTAQVQKVESLLNRDRRELNRTPFVLWMLYHVIHETGTVADTLGEAFRQFFQSFKGRLEAAPVTDDRRKAWDRWLKHLAFTMLSSPDSQDPGLIIAEEDAEAVLFKEFPPPHETPSLNELLKYHLLQEEKGKITFHHQLIQEYYAAEALRLKLDKLTDEELKCNYLNYLKWTEPIALMLALLENSETALQVVQWALDVDLTLGARLASEVKLDLQKQTVELLTNQVQTLRLPKQFELMLLGITHSDKAVPKLENFIADPDVNIRWSVVDALGRISSNQAILALSKALEDQHSWVSYRAIEALCDMRAEQISSVLLTALTNRDSYVRMKAAEALGKIGLKQLAPQLLALAAQDYDPKVRRAAAEAARKIDPQQEVLALYEATESLEAYTIPTDLISSSCEFETELELPSVSVLLVALKESNPYIRDRACYLLGESSLEEAPLVLLQVAREDTNPDVRFSAIEALGKIGSKATVSTFIVTTEDPEPEIRGMAVEILGKIGSPEGIPALLKVLNDCDADVRSSAAVALGRFKDDHAALILPNLLELMFEGNQAAFRALTAIQANCKFYNYEIYQQAQARREQTKQQTNQAAQPTMTIGSVGVLNTGSVTIKGNQMGIQQSSQVSGDE